MPSASTHPQAEHPTLSTHARQRQSQIAWARKFAFLQEVTLFEGLQEPLLKEIAGQLHARTCQPGQPIFHEGDPGNQLYIVKRGIVRIFVDGSGQETSVILFGRPGDIFGELAIIDGLPRSATAIGMTRVTYYQLDRELFRDLMRRHPQLSLNFMSLLSRRVRRTTRQYKSMASMDITSRLARTLLSLANDYGSVEAGGVRLNADLNQTELASLIGATRESTNKALRIFRKEELIRKTREGILILDPEGLRAKVKQH